MHRPLADEIRPLELDDVVGQKHILGPGGLLRRVIDSGNIPNMVFYGPSGTGKTTVANIIARKTDRTLRRLNATNASLADIKSIIAELDTMLAPGGVLLYLDEIQYFNKSSSRASSSSSRTAASRSSPPPPRTRISTSITRCSPAAPYSSSSPYPPPRSCPRSGARLT